MKKSILLVAAAIGMLAASCNKEILDQQEDLTKTPITISAKYDSNNSKVSYTESGSNITATWDAGDELIVCWNNHKNTLTLSSGAGTSSATFTGTITGTPSANSTLVCFVKDSKNPGAVTVSDNGDYLYTSDAFLTQDGSMDSAASRNLYYGTCFYGDGTNISCTFSVNTSMMKFHVYAPAGISEGTTGATLTYKSGSTELAKATFTVGADGENTIYLTIPSGHYTGEQTLVYHSGSITGTETLSSTQANFVAGQTYSKTLLFSNTPVDDPLEEPLTFEAMDENVTITFTPGWNMTLPIEYSINDGITWTTYSSPITLANVGDKVSFRGDNAAYCNSNYINSDDESHFSFSTNSHVYVYGNIMSLINSTDYATITTMTAENKYAFRGFFKTNSGEGYHLYNHPSKNLIMPATILAEGCYYEMFKYCTNIDRAPELPATTLAPQCYSNMFYYCENLIIAPEELPATTLAPQCYSKMFFYCSNLTTIPDELPATTLSEGCYSSMFEGCSNLTTAPELPATTMAENCYSSMFFNTSLSTAPELPATTLASYCYSGMFGRTSLTTAPALPATILAAGCYSGMFTYCTRLTTAPDLPAANLVSGCYFGMFFGCSRLNYVKCLATTNLEDLYSGGEAPWLGGVSSSGTFIKAEGVDWRIGSEGIPSGWTVQEE